MKRLTLLLALIMTTVISISAEELESQETNAEKATIEVPAWVKNIKFSGYGMLQYQGQDPEGNHTNSFNLRLARFILDGKIGDFDWRAQIQGTNVKGPGEPTVQLVDLYTEWRKYPESPSRMRTPPTLLRRAGVAMQTLSTTCQVSETVLVRSQAVVVTSVSSCQVTCSPMLKAVACCTIKLVSTMVRVSTARMLTIRRILSEVCG